MNKQLREFERASGLEIFGLGAKRDKWEAALEKYAELIVRECDNYARSAWEHGPLLGRDLLVHFGIVEMKDDE
jgi:hypothetical protein